MRRFEGELFALALAVVVVLPSLTMAQGLPSTQRPEVLDVPPPAPSPGIELKRPELAPPPAPLPESIRVRAFHITGLASIPVSEVEPVLSSWIDRDLTASQVLQAANDLTAYLRERGLFVAQVYVPERAIREGVVELAVIEGRIGEVRLDVPADLRVRRSVVERFLGDLRTGDTIRTDNVEQSLQRLNDLPGVQVTASLAPVAPLGTADVLVGLENVGRAATGSLILDNAGYKPLGEYRAEANLRLPSPGGIGDLLSFRLQQSNTGGQSIFSMTYGMPVNGLGTRVGARYYVQRYRLGGEFAVLEGHGDEHSLALVAAHPLVRTGKGNVTLSGGYFERHFSDSLDAVGLVNESRHRVAIADIAGDLQDRWLGGGVTVFLAAYARGRVFLDTPEIAALDESSGLNVGGDFSTVRLRLLRNQNLAANTSLLLSFDQQFASKNLAPGNELEAAGPNAVRAYPVGELYADQGYVARVELRRSLTIAESSPTVLSLFYDEARVQINRNPLPGDTANRRAISGWGVGVNQALAWNTTIQAWLAWRTTEAPLTDADRLPRVWVAAATRF